MTFLPGFADEHLVIDADVASGAEAVTFGTPACFAESLAPLFNIEKRGSDRRIPAGSVLTYQRRTDILSVRLVIHVLGDVDDDGVPIVGARGGLYDHLDWLDANLLVDVEDTRTAIWTRPNGTVRTAECHVESWVVTGNTPISAECALELTFPDGRFTESAS